MNRADVRARVQKTFRTRFRFLRFWSARVGLAILLFLVSSPSSARCSQVIHRASPLEPHTRAPARELCLGRTT